MMIQESNSNVTINNRSSTVNNCISSSNATAIDDENDDSMNSCTPTNELSLQPQSSSTTTLIATPIITTRTSRIYDVQCCNQSSLLPARVETDEIEVHPLIVPTETPLEHEHEHQHLQEVQDSSSNISYIYRYLKRLKRRQEERNNSIGYVSKRKMNYNKNNYTTNNLFYCKCRSKNYYYYWYTTNKQPIRPDLYITHTIQQNGCCCLLPSTRKFIRYTIQSIISIIIIVFIILYIGVQNEQYHVRQLNNTTITLYNQQSTICGIIILNDNTVITNDTTTIQTTQTSYRMETFPSLDSFNQTTSSIVAASAGSSSRNTSSTFISAHCGNCGYCSNPHDIRIYDETSNTLFTKTTKCAKYALLWGRKTATSCMKDQVQFTTKCNNCWVENIMCDLRKCIFTCLWYGLFSQIDGSTVISENNETTTTNTSTQQQQQSNKSLNPCTKCDELRCGYEFISCAGANRRRCGIISDIERNTKLEVCTSISPPEWYNNPIVYQQWYTSTATSSNNNT